MRNRNTFAAPFAPPARSRLNGVHSPIEWRGNQGAKIAMNTVHIQLAKQSLSF
jgi:hypothetical protein